MLYTKLININIRVSYIHLIVYSYTSLLIKVCLNLEGVIPDLDFTGELNAALLLE